MCTATGCPRRSKTRCRSRWFAMWWCRCTVNGPSHHNVELITDVVVSTATVVVDYADGVTVGDGVGCAAGLEPSRAAGNLAGRRDARMATRDIEVDGYAVRCDAPPPCA